ncbi:hypothetical protein C0J52_12520 [Blattella germanica]|nr:hypothetical protein C0J52_12520 [Blattella germanica]
MRVEIETQDTPKEQQKSSTVLRYDEPMLTYVAQDIELISNTENKKQNEQTETSKITKVKWSDDIEESKMGEDTCTQSNELVPEEKKTKTKKTKKMGQKLGFPVRKK